MFMSFFFKECGLVTGLGKPGTVVMGLCFLKVCRKNVSLAVLKNYILHINKSIMGSFKRSRYGDIIKFWFTWRSVRIAFFECLKSRMLKKEIISSPMFPGPLFARMGDSLIREPLSLFQPFKRGRRVIALE